MPMHRHSPTPQVRYIPSLLQIHFLRKIVDEGHGLTSGPNVPDVLSMATLVAAERRWVLTGTPTTIPVLSMKTLAQAQTQAQKQSQGSGSSSSGPSVTLDLPAAAPASSRTLCGVESSDFHLFAAHLYRVCPSLSVAAVTLCWLICLCLHVYMCLSMGGSCLHFYRWGDKAHGAVWMGGNRCCCDHPCSPAQCHTHAAITPRPRSRCLPLCTAYSPRSCYGSRNGILTFRHPPDAQLYCPSMPLSDIATMPPWHWPWLIW